MFGRVRICRPRMAVSHITIRPHNDRQKRENRERYGPETPLRKRKLSRLVNCLRKDRNAVMHCAPFAKMTDLNILGLVAGAHRQPDALQADLAVSSHEPLAACEFGQPHGPARVQLLRRNANLGTETEFSPIREPRRRIDHNDGRIDLGKETLSVRQVFRNNAFRVTARMLPDV